ncbi:MAG: CRISPR-associated protein Cmr2 [Myxacorys californica WJT36-NPBG1]|nr:CRISPR-associated protein Cmr2 [Myxacorys californica WJT36-NPBG1]
MSAESASQYTVISFAPVQGFIEKSRKLRDLFGASLILSYLSFKLVEEAEQVLGKGSVISPGLIRVQEGMPNRILVKGHLTREIVQNTLLREWQEILRICREWVEDNIGIPKNQYFWSQTDDQIGKQKGEWERWGSHAWEVFVGWGKNNPDDSTESTIKAAMEDLETRKLKRDWTGINWIGESSSLSGTDAIAWHCLGREHLTPGRALTPDEKEEMELFYYRLAWRLDNPDRLVKPPFPDLKKLKEIENSNQDNFGKYVAPNERLSVPELVKRLVTYEAIADAIGILSLEKGFTEIARMPEIGMEKGRWTGWFMGDGDEVGKKLKKLTGDQGDEHLQQFSLAMREWGGTFKQKFSQDLGRVIYAGGDDFLGVLYRSKRDQPIEPLEAFQWLRELPDEWKNLQADLQEALHLKMTFSVGFVWAGHSVPQRDILQHCREAEKHAKSLGRDRVTIRVVFNSGQYVQWTCPWAHLQIIERYSDRIGGKNWAHLYNDWAHLKSRRAIQFREINNNSIDRDLALAMLDLYFGDLGQEIQTAKEKENQWKAIAGDNSDAAVVQWINDLVQVGWQLCSNT